MNKNNAARQAQTLALTEKQILVLETIAKAADHLADNHIDRKTIKFSPDVFNALKRKDLVDAHGKFVWVTKAGLKAIAQPATVVPAETPKPAATEKKPRAEKDGLTLDWAFRRLRRQAVLFFGGEDADKRRAMREKLDNIVAGYATLAGEFGGPTSHRWLEFMEHFFSNIIHPGSRGPAK